MKHIQSGDGWPSVSRTTSTAVTGYAEAREVAEQAREREWARPSFGKQLFLGDFRLDLVHPAPRLGDAAVRKGEDFLRTLRRFLEAKVDPQLIERDAQIPDEVVRGLAAIGAFGMTIDEDYGGLGLSHLYYSRALLLVSSYSPAIGTLLSAHQSIARPEVMHSASSRTVRPIRSPVSTST